MTQHARYEEITNKCVELKSRAASLHYHGAKSISMSEADFEAVFIAGEVQGASEKGVVTWSYYGLTVERAEALQVKYTPAGGDRAN